MPGFEPYLVFLRDTVFLKFDSRAYKQLEEKVNDQLLKITSTVNI